MRFHQVRNATVVLELGDEVLLVFSSFRYTTRERQRNPISSPTAAARPSTSASRS